MAKNGRFLPAIFLIEGLALLARRGNFAVEALF
jgi:hypothetical protein